MLTMKIMRFENIFMEVLKCMNQVIEGSNKKGWEIKQIFIYCILFYKKSVTINNKTKSIIWCVFELHKSCLLVQTIVLMTWKQYK